MQRLTFEITNVHGMVIGRGVVPLEYLTDGALSGSRTHVRCDFVNPRQPAMFFGVDIFATEATEATEPLTTHLA